MTTKVKGRLLTTFALITAVVTLAAALRPVVRPVWRDSIVAVADSVYVRLDSAQLQRLRDSVSRTLRSDPEAAKLDTILHCIKAHHPKWCE